MVAIVLISIAAIWIAGSVLFLLFAAPYLRVRWKWTEDGIKVWAITWPFIGPFALPVVGFLKVLDLIYEKFFENVIDRKVDMLEKEQAEVKRKQREVRRQMEEREEEELARARVRDQMEREKENKNIPQPVFREPPKPCKHCTLCGSDEVNWRKSLLAEEEAAAEEEAHKARKKMLDEAGGESFYG